MILLDSDGNKISGGDEANKNEDAAADSTLYGWIDPSPPSLNAADNDNYDDQLKILELSQEASSKW